ncbi:MAG: KpsF/GutQ family sugar-phosphate isomerase [Thermodesulfobacteriota bacterium]
MIIEAAKRVLRTEAESILTLIDRVDERFLAAVDLIYNCQGKVVITGMGKSGIICRKIAATFSSYGTPAFFLHPAEGFHGDLGMLVKGDLVIAVSNRGETDEINRLLPLIKRMGLQLIVLTGNQESTLGRAGDVTIDIGVKEEACPLGLAPTSSTTAALAFGDALAVALLLKRGFKEEDFALLHPGGSLGRALLLRVEDLMHSGDAVPLVRRDTLMRDAIFEISSKRMGITGVIDEEGNLEGVIADGDLRRGLEKDDQLLVKKACQVMTSNPKRVNGKELAAKALRLMEEHAITSLFVYQGEEESRAVGIIHMHDLVKAGIV